MKFGFLILPALVSLVSSSAWSQTNTISSLAIGTASTAGGTATGVVVVTPLIGTAGNQPGSVSNTLAGLQYVAGQIPLNGAPASIAFYALSGGAIPGGAANPASDFTSYGTLTTPTAVTSYADAASKLTPDSYSGLTFAAANLGFGSGNFYMIHHTPGTDYLSEIVPGTGTATLIADLKPMSWTGPTAGGPASPGTNGYFGLAWATGILSAGAPYADQSLYYLRTSTGDHTIFGVMIPALTGASADTLDLTTAVGSFGAGGYTVLAFSPTAIGAYGPNQFYYLRQDPLTGNTILGWLNPSLLAGARTVSDIANLGGVFHTLTFASDSTGPAGAWGSSQFYASGALAPGAQSISFAAIPNHNVGDVFAVTPTASSGLDIDLTVVSGPATVEETGVSGASPLSLRAFQVTTTGPGIVTLQARQAGRSGSPAFSANLLQQSFNVIGAPVITNSPLTAAGTLGTPFIFSITALGSPSSFTASPLPAGLVIAADTGTITGTPTALGTTDVLLGATNASGTGNATLVITIGAADAPPVITNTPLAAAGTVGSLFSYLITATGLPTSFSANPLPPGLVVAPSTGIISGTPTSPGTTNVLLGATNASGTGFATLVVTVAAAGTAPVITNLPLTAAGTVGTPFSFTIAATGSPTSYAASPLPGGLSIVTATGAITGTPETAGTTNVLLAATNATGTGNATLVVTVAPAGTAPVITNLPLTAAGTVGTPFSFTITATGLPTTYAASPLPSGLSIVAATGAITGTPEQAGTTAVLLAATNAAGTGYSTLIVTVANPGLPPVITNIPLTAAGIVGTPFSYTITASGLPSTYSASPLPAGLSIVAVTGAITGTPTIPGTTFVQLGATNAGGTGFSTLVITVAVAGTPPVIVNNQLTAAGTVGVPFGYTITAPGLSNTYTAAPLPPGLSIVAATGVITGTPTTAGVTVVNLSAVNALGTDYATLTITVAPAGAAPIVANNPLVVAGYVGIPFGYLITASGLPTAYTAAPLPAGLTLFGTIGLITGTPTAAGTTVVNLGAANSAGTGTAQLTIVIGPAPLAPAITSQPENETIAAGGSFTFNAGASGTPGPAYQWYFDASPIAGATGASLTRADAGPGSAGTYTVIATNLGGYVISNSAVLTVDYCDIADFSARAQTGPGSQMLTLGFVLSGAKTVLVRGIGPALAGFGVADPLPDPLLTLFSGNTVMATDAGWQTPPANPNIAAVSAQFGAFALPAGSLDSALLATLNAGPFTAQVVSSNYTAVGAAMVEVYDADFNVGSRLLNASALMQVNPDGDNATPIIIGFIIQGTGTKTVLLRGVGPGLAAFGLTGVLADPQINVYAGDTLLAGNAGWSSGGNAAQLSATFAQVGAFALPDGSADSALVLTLAPGAYSVLLGSAANHSGVALLEVYDVQ